MMKGSDESWKRLCLLSISAGNIFLIADLQKLFVIPSEYKHNDFVLTLDDEEPSRTSPHPAHCHSRL